VPTSHPGRRLLQKQTAQPGTVLEVQRRLVGTNDAALAPAIPAAGVQVCRILARKVLPHPAIRIGRVLVCASLLCMMRVTRHTALVTAVESVWMSTPKQHTSRTPHCQSAHHFMRAGPLSSWPRVRPWRRAYGAARSACGRWWQRLHRS
jgi:hypothetical protein